MLTSKLSLRWLLLSSDHYICLCFTALFIASSVFFVLNIHSHVMKFRIRQYLLMFRPSSVIILWSIITTINGSSDETMSFLLHTFHKNSAVLQIDFIPYNNYLILMSCRYTIDSSRWPLDSGPISRSWAANALHCAPAAARTSVKKSNTE